MYIVTGYQDPRISPETSVTAEGNIMASRYILATAASLKAPLSVKRCKKEDDEGGIRCQEPDMRSRNQERRERTNFNVGGLFKYFRHVLRQLVCRQRFVCHLGLYSRINLSKKSQAQAQKPSSEL